MKDFSKLTAKDLAKAVNDIRSAIQSGQDLLKYVANNSATLGVQKMAHATPAQLDKLENELERLEGELSKNVPK